jgi:hypothetical protein
MRPHYRHTEEVPELDIDRLVAIELPCKECGGVFHVSLGQILLAQEGMHGKCNALGAQECPGLFYADLISQDLARTLVHTWQQIRRHAEDAGGHLVLVTEGTGGQLSPGLAARKTEP